MHPFDLAAIVVAIAAVSGYVNHRLLKLPATSGTLAIALFSSLVLVAAEAVFPDLAFQERVTTFLGRIDFNTTLMGGMLCFLLFAGALHVDAKELFRNKWTIGVLSTLGVLLSTAVIGVLAWLQFSLVGAPLPLVVCLTFGALISPTDPIAVMGLLKELRAPKALEAQIGGESLFNDGIGVVVFFALAGAAGLSSDHGPTDVTVNAVGVLTFFLRQVAGGLAVGLAGGFVAYRALLTIDDYALELQITLALAMFVYAVSAWIGVSGPLAVVAAGLLIGNRGRDYAMTDRTKDYVDAFWTMIDELLNTVLFLLIGLQFLAVPRRPMALVAALATIPIVLGARLLAVGLTVTALQARRQPAVRGLVPVLTWAGLRGGLSIAMMLSLPPFPGRDLLLACTYAVVVFSILVQGLTVRRVLVYYGFGQRPA